MTEAAAAHDSLSVVEADKGRRVVAEGEVIAGDMRISRT
jgi:hypothetical protein